MLTAIHFDFLASSLAADFRRWTKIERGIFVRHLCSTASICGQSLE
jgi:hypothetical protein